MRGRATRDLKLLCGAVFLSAAGDMLALITLALLVHDLTGSGIIVSAFFAATMIPVVALAPAAGLLADRVESVRLIRLASMASALIALGLAFTVSVPLIMILTAALAAASAFSQPAEFALIPVMSRPGRLTESNGLIESARYAGFAFGPLAASALVAAGSIRLALLANAASFLAITIAALLMRSRRRPPERSGGTSRQERRRQSREGFTYLWQNRVLRMVVLTSTGALFFLSAFMTIEVFWIKDVLEAGDSVYAVSTAVWMVSMVVGATVLAGRVPRRYFAVAAMAGLAVQGFGIGGPALVVAIPPVLIGSAIGGIGHGIKNTLTRTIIHADVPEHLHGRAFAAYSGMRNSAEVTALAIGGLMVSTAGPRLALLAAGFAPFLIALAGLLLLRFGGTRAPAGSTVNDDPHPEGIKWLEKSSTQLKPTWSAAAPTDTDAHQTVSSK